MDNWLNPIPQQRRLQFLFCIIILGFIAITSIHFTLHKLATNRENTSGQTRIQINLLHHLSEEIRGVQTLYFIWPAIKDPLHKNQAHTEIQHHIDQIFKTIHILEYGGSIPPTLIPPDLAHKANANQFTSLGINKQLSQNTIPQLKTDLQTLFADIEFLHNIFQTTTTISAQHILKIQQKDSALFSSLYETTQELISTAKKHLGHQQIIITKRQQSYNSLEIFLILTTLCTLFFLTWRVSKQLMLATHILHDKKIYIENETRQHTALNAILAISMENSPLKTQLDQSLLILLNFMNETEQQISGALFLPDPKQKSLILTVQHGLPDNFPCLSSFADFSTCQCGTSFHTGDMLHHTKDHESQYKCSGYNVIYSIPIGPHNRPIGVLMLAFPSKNTDQEKIAFLKFVTPILAGIISKGQYEQQLGKSELATLDIFHESAQAILLLRDNEIIDWNSGAAKLFKAGSLVDFPATHDLQNLLETRQDHDKEKPFQHHTQIALTEGVSHTELRLSKQDNSTFLASLTFTTIPLHGEHIIYLVIQDISAREAEKQALIHAKNEAEKASAAKSTFLTTISHEILTPLNAILGITTLTMNLELSAETRENLEIIHTSSQSLKVLVTDILDISKIEADQFTAIAIPFSIRDSIKKLQQTYEPMAQQQNILFTTTIDPNTPDNISGDPSRLIQVLSKLIANSFKYTNQGTIELSARCQKKSTTSCCILFTIQDSGIGMDQIELKNIFSGFNPEHNSEATHHSGMALGLTISKKIVEKMGGTIRATSAPNKGSSFFVEITFPLGQPLTQDIMAQQPLKPHLTGKKILVVEDSPINLKVTSQTLFGMGVTVFEAVNGKEGVAAMTPSLDAVLMDVEMPVMDGITATKIIRENPRYNHIPIIAITAHGINADKNLCFKAGMNDYMTKPLEPEVLLQVLSRNIQPSPSKSVGPIDYDAGIKKVGGDHAFFDEILQDFSKLYHSEGTLLTDLFRQQNFSEIKERAHKLKGIAGTISAQEFAHQTKLLEKLAQAQSPDPIEIEIAILQVKLCIEDIVKEIG